MGGYQILQLRSYNLLNSSDGWGKLLLIVYMFIAYNDISFLELLLKKYFIFLQMNNKEEHSASFML